MTSAPLVVLPALRAPQFGEQDVPFCSSVQLTPLPAGSLVSVPVNDCVPLSATLADVGEREIVTAGIVILAEADFVGSSCDVAVTVTVRSLAGAGAV